MDELLADAIRETVQDMSEDQVTRLVEHLISPEIGVKSLERLYDVDLADMTGIVSKCDATLLFRTWQSKYKPRSETERTRASCRSQSTYSIKWNTVAAATLAKCENGQWLKKPERCDLVAKIVQDVLHEDPSFPRPGFTKIAEAMVAKYPSTFQDLGPNAKPLSCSYYTNKLKFRYDEVLRSKKNKAKNECPNIPQAYGCVRWRVAQLPESKEDLLIRKQAMVDIFQNSRRSDWDWDLIQDHMKATFGLQREDINSQTPPKPPRKGQRQVTQPEPRTTRQIDEDWPMLLHPKGMAIHFTELTKKPAFLNQLNQFDHDYGIATFVKFLKKEIGPNREVYSNYKSTLKRTGGTEPQCIAMCLMLVNVMQEEQKLIIREVEQTMRMEEVEADIVLPPTPCIISLGPVFSAKKYYFCIDGNVTTTTKKFSLALALLFQSYFAFNIQYPEGISNTLEFYQRVIAKICPEKGSKSVKKNYKNPVSARVQTILDKYQVYQDSLNADKENEDPNIVEEEM